MWPLVPAGSSLYRHDVGRLKAVLAAHHELLTVPALDDAFFNIPDVNPAESTTATVLVPLTNEQNKRDHEIFADIRPSSTIVRLAHAIMQCVNSEERAACDAFGRYAQQ